MCFGWWKLRRLLGHVEVVLEAVQRSMLGAVLDEGDSQTCTAKIAQIAEVTPAQPAIQCSLSPVIELPLRTVLQAHASEHVFQLVRATDPGGGFVIPTPNSSVALRATGCLHRHAAFADGERMTCCSLTIVQLARLRGYRPFSQVYQCPVPRKSVAIAANIALFSSLVTVV